MKQVGVEPARQAARVIDAAGERLAERREVEVGLKPLLGIAQQEFFAEVGQRRALAQSDNTRPSPNLRTLRK